MMSASARRQKSVPQRRGARISEGSLGEILRYSMLYMPGAILLLGLAVYLRRRISDPGAAAEEKA